MTSAICSIPPRGSLESMMASPTYTLRLGSLTPCIVTLSAIFYPYSVDVPSLDTSDVILPISTAAGQAAHVPDELIVCQRGSLLPPLRNDVSRQT